MSDKKAKETLRIITQAAAALLREYGYTVIPPLERDDQPKARCALDQLLSEYVEAEAKRQREIKS